MSNLTSVAIPVSLLKQARKYGINVSKTSREAVAEAVKKMEHTGNRKPNLRQNDSESPAADGVQG